MTRETALRRMLAGQKVEHPECPEFYYVYEFINNDPIIKIKKDDEHYIVPAQRSFFSYRKGWKEYKPLA